MTEPRNEALSAAHERTTELEGRAFSAERSLEVAQARIRELEAERDRYQAPQQPPYRNCSACGQDLSAEDDVIAAGKERDRYREALGADRQAGCRQDRATGRPPSPLRW